MDAVILVYLDFVSVAWIYLQTYLQGVTGLHLHVSHYQFYLQVRKLLL